MASYQTERDQFVAEASRAGFRMDQIRGLLRAVSTLHRLAEAQCNGDYPYNGSRDDYLHGETREARQAWRQKWYGTCDRCEAECRKSQLTRPPRLPEQTREYRAAHRNDRACPDCRTQDRVRRILLEGPMGERSAAHAVIDPSKPAWMASFGGDPRGAVLRLWPAGVAEDDVHCGNERACPEGMRPIYVPARPTRTRY